MQRNLKTQQSPVVLDLCLRKTRSGKSRDYRDVIIFKKLRFQNVFRSHENKKPTSFPGFLFSSSLGRSLFQRPREEEKRDPGNEVDKKPAFSNSSGLKNVFEKLRFRDGLVWTVGLTGEIKLRFQISSAWLV